MPVLSPRISPSRLPLRFALRQLLLAVVLTAHPISAQAPASPNPLLALSPQAAYDQAVAPVAIVHRSISNWSPAETASFAVAVAEAQSFCKARPAAQFNGPDLLGLARLCALGEQWPAVLEASNQLLASLPVPPPLPATASPSSASPRAQALAFKIQAALNLQDPATAFTTGHILLSTEPYTTLSQQSTDTLLRYLQLIQTGDALNLAGERLDHLLPLLRTSAEPPSAAVPSTQLPSPDTLSTHELYAAALAAPTLLQLEGNAPAAAQTLGTIEAAVPAQLSLDESTLVALARRRYHLLGSPLPEIAASVSLFSPGETPRINRNFGTATVLLLFPDWCAQCVRMASTQFMPFLTRHTEDNLHLYGLLALPKPPPVLRTPAAPARHPQHATSAQTTAVQSDQDAPTAADLLRGTPTLVVAANLPLDTFATTDFPLLVVTDHEGRIRFADTAPDNAFVPGGTADQVAARMVELWPPSPTPEPHP